MTILEFLRTNRQVFRYCIELGIKWEDIKYIDMISEYNQMLKEGRIKANVKALMCRRYKISRKKFESIEERLNHSFSVDIFFQDEG